MVPGTISIKNSDVLIGLMERRFHPLLISIVTHIAERYGVFITESYREKRHMNDLHGTQPVRAVDIRYRCYPEKIAIEMIDEINKKWVYDPNRPDKKVMYAHGSGSSFHVHVQVRQNTRRR